MGVFDDLIPKAETQSPATSDPFADLIPQKGFVESKVDFAKSVGSGVVTAPISLVQGIAELGAAALDFTVGSNTSRPTTEFFNYAKNVVGPQDSTARATDEIVGFGLGFIPFVGWLGRGAKVAGGAKFIPSASKFLSSAEKFGATETGKALLKTRPRQIATTAAAAGGYETLFSPDGRTTLSDAFDLNTPLRTEADTGLTGRDEAIRRIKNKLRSGVEGAALSAGFDTVLAGLGIGIGAAARTEAGAATAKAVKTGFDVLGTAVSKIPGAKTVGRVATKYLTPTGGADPRVFEEMMDTITRVDATEAGGIKAYAEYESALKNTISKLKLPGKGADAANEAERDLFGYLTGTGPNMSKYGPEVQKASERLLGVADKVRGDFVSSVEREVATALPGTDRAVKLNSALKTIREQQESERGFLRRAFLAHKDPITFYKALDLVGKDKQLYDEAVAEVSSHLHTGQGDAWASPEAMALARYKVNDYIGLSSINSGLSPKAAAKKMLDSLKAERLAPQGGLFARDAPRLKMTPTLLTPREAILDSSPKLRQLLGEVTDPKELYYQTIGDTAKTTEALNFYQNMSKSGLVSSLADAIPAINSGRRPLFVQVPNEMAPSSDFDFGPFIQKAQELRVNTTVPEGIPSGISPKFSGDIQVSDIIKSYADELAQSGYVKLGEDNNLTDVFRGQFGALSGMYVDQNVYRAITAPLRIGVTGLDEVFSILTQLRGLTQKMTVVPSIPGQVRQIFGNTLMLAGTDNLGRSTDVFDVFKLFTSNLADLEDKGLERLAKVISLSGVTESNLVVKALQQYREAGADLAVSGKLRNVITKAEGWIPFLRAFERLYANSDSFFKAVAVVSEQNKLMRAFSDAGLNPNGQIGLLQNMQDAGIIKRLSSKANPELTSVEVAAADAVKNMFAIYGRVGLAVRELDKLPLFGNFMSFASENIRNSVNVLDRGLKEMSFTVSDSVRSQIGEEAAKIFEGRIREMGARRLASYVSVATILPKAAVRASMVATGTTPDQMQSFYSQLPDYTAGNDIVITSNDKNGKFEYINLSYTSPYSFAVDPAVAGLRAYYEKGRLGAGEAEKIASGIWTSVSSYADPFGSESMAFERLRDVLPNNMLGRQGKTSTGATVYSESDSLSDKVLSGINHVWTSYLPAYAREIITEREGALKKGRLSRAFTDTPGKQGQEYNLPTEFARMVSGFTPMELNLKRDFQFSGLEYSPLRQDAKTSATRVIRAPDSTPEEMRQAWSTYLDNLYREQGKLYGDIQAARTLGLSDASIRRQLVKEAKLGSDEVNSIMRGQFYPGKASEELYTDIRAQERNDKIVRKTPSTSIPFQDFMQMSRSRFRESLVAPEKAEAPTRTLPQPADPFADLIPSVPVAAAPIAPPAPRAPSPPPAPQLPAAPLSPQSKAALSPSLLGGDPISQQLNSEIAQRLQQP